jgi:hypothetical protein
MKYEEESVNRTQNGSKTAVIDIIEFLCVSLGISTVKLHESLADAHVHVQRLVSVVKMVTVCEG